METRRTRAKQRRTARALRGLSNHALKDIGINRSEITSVAIGASDNHKRG